MSEYFDRQNNPINADVFHRLRRNTEYCHVKRTELNDGTVVLTSWFGAVRTYGPAGPMIFSTVVNEPEGTRLIYLHATEQEALEQHDCLAEVHHDDHKLIPRWRQVVNEL